MRDFVVMTSSLIRLKPGIQELQAFAFCVVTVKEEHAKPRFKRKHGGQM